MADKALITDLTWRSLEMQQAAFPDMPVFVGVDEIPNMLRKTTRNEPDNIHVLSLGVIADNEKDFITFIKLARQRGATIHSREELNTYHSRVSTKEVVADWKAARKNGVAKVGGKISADKRKARSAEGVAKIKDRWGMPSKTWPTKVLLKEADISYNTAKTLLPPRPIAQYNYRAKLKRKARKE